MVLARALTHPDLQGLVWVNNVHIWFIFNWWGEVLAVLRGTLTARPPDTEG